MSINSKFNLSDSEESIGRAIINAAHKIHCDLGPGLLEKVYEVCLCHELQKTGFNVERQVALPIHYDGVIFDEGLRLDLLIEKKVVIETKAVDEVNPVWMAQVLSHLRLSGLQLGYLINFNVPIIKNGIRRVVLSKDTRTPS